jgi:putative ABC transport system permease protein
MFKSYLKIAWRNIKRHRVFSFINISGLAIGIACSVLIAIFVLFELSFDGYHEKSDRIYRVGSQFGPTPDKRGAYTAPPMAEAMIHEFPEIEHIARLSLWSTNYLVEYKEKSFLEKGIIYGDASIFDVFTIPFVLGNPKTALVDPYTVVITEAIARKYFGNEDPLGESFRFNNEKEDYKITGVVENCPRNSHFQFDMIVSLVSRRSSRSDRWMQHTYFTYIVLKNGCTPSQLEAKFPNFIKRHYGPQFFADTGMSFEEHFQDENNYYGYWLQPLGNIHLNADIVDNLPQKGDITYVYIFSSIALFILLIACINFMNLSTARFANRSKEVGVRKVLGCSKKQLVSQFLGESVLLSIIALVIAFIVIQIVLPAFSNLAGRQLKLDLLSNFYVLPLMIGFALFVGILAGTYPAFFLSSFQPVRTIKGSLNKRVNGHLVMRRALVILQFSITIFIFLGTFVIYNQLKYVRDKKLGFDKEQVIVIHRANVLRQQGDAFKQELLKYPNILTVSNTDSLPGRHFDPNGHRLEGRPLTEEYTLYTMYGDYNFVDLLDLEIVAGRYFSKDIVTDATSAVVINETAVKELGLTDPIGKRFHKGFGGAKKGEFVTIIGVLKDIHFQSLHHEIHPMIIRPLTGWEGFYTSVRVRPENLSETIGLIEETWTRFSGGQPFEYSFLDTDLDNLYRAEQKTGQIFAIFSFLAIFVACLGLFGLISFAAEQRTREIGIRKVLGASVSRIIYLLSKEILILVSAAIFIASPVAFYAMSKWLESFAFRIEMSPLMFIMTALAASLIALLSVGYRAVKSALANPADALRYE